MAKKSLVHDLLLSEKHVGQDQVDTLKAVAATGYIGESRYLLCFLGNH